MATADETQQTTHSEAEEAENTVLDEGAQLGVRRYFTIPGRDPFDEVEWETRDAFIPGKDKPVFEQKGVEFPKFWSQTATNIVAQKYFRGRMASPEREFSVKQMIGRVVTTIGRWGRDGGYFASEDEAQTFEDELKAILVNQLAAFNSPVWFNVGFEEKPQCSACFILSIEDSMDAILDWIRREGIIFRGGSGSGVNLSRLRSSKEQLSKGGYASGPVSFMRGADASAGTIKSGGKTRPAPTAPSSRRRTRATCCTRLRKRPGSAPIRASSTTRRSTRGTRSRTRAGSTRRTHARSTCRSTTQPATSPRST